VTRSSAPTGGPADGSGSPAPARLAGCGFGVLAKTA
jgi:hypothetical protein